MDIIDIVIAKSLSGGGTVDAYTKAESDALLDEKMDLETDYITLGNGTRVYFTDTAPTGTIPEGSYGFGF